MSDVALTWSNGAADLDIVGGDLALDDGLETACLISLMSDRRAAAFDRLPDGQVDPRGWWGDLFALPVGDQIGSKLWLLAREKQSPDVLAQARTWGEEMLAWMIEDRVAAAVSVDATFPARGWLTLAITITKPTGRVLTYRFDYTWQAEAARGALAIGPTVALVEIPTGGAVGLVVNLQLQLSATSGSGTPIDTNGLAERLVVYIVCNGAPGGMSGSVQLKEAHSLAWPEDSYEPLDAPIDVSGGRLIVRRLPPGCYRVIMADITTPIAGGTVDVFLMGN